MTAAPLPRSTVTTAPPPEGWVTPALLALASALTGVAVAWQARRRTRLRRRQARALRRARRARRVQARALQREMAGRFSARTRRDLGLE